MALWVERHTITEEYSDFGRVWNVEAVLVAAGGCDFADAVGEAFQNGNRVFD